MFRVGKFTKTKSILRTASSWGEGKRGVTANRYMIFFGIMKTSGNYIVVMFLQLCEYTINY